VVEIEASHLACRPQSGGGPRDVWPAALPVLWLRAHSPSRYQCVRHRGMAGEEVGVAEEAEEECHDGVGNLLGAIGVDMEEAEAELGGHDGINNAVEGGEAEQHLRGAESLALRDSREEGEREEQHGDYVLDTAGRERGEHNILSSFMQHCCSHAHTLSSPARIEGMRRKENTEGMVL
jgi:hypothetical protein